jgi:NADPH2:quinone reductase
MRAMLVRETGGRLEPAEVAAPEPGPGQALIRVRTCGVNFADTLMVTGAYQETPPLPFAPGMEVCGVVERLGPGVEGPPPGTRVMAMAGAGGFAEFAVAAAGGCARVPDEMTDEAAAAMPVAYGTGHIALAHRARLARGERLLVTGAGGGVGLTAVEIGRLMGAEVIAVARGAEKQALAREKGAAHVLDADPAALRDAVKALGGADVVYDAVGGALWKEALRAANFEARLLPIGFASGDVPMIPANILLVKNLTVIGVYWGAYLRLAPAVLADSFETILGWWRAGMIEPHVSHVLPLEMAEEALDLLRSRTATGKVVVRVAQA